MTKFYKKLGPGPITGASDDDPSGIATYSQAGAQFGLMTLWMAFFTFPRMVAIQEMSGRIDLVTGKGLAHILKDHYSKVLLYFIMTLTLHDHALLLYLIHFADEIREEDEVNVPKDDIKTYKVSDKEIKMAEALIKDMATTWTPEKYHNEYRETMQKWLDIETAKLKKSGKKLSKSAAVKSNDSVVDFISLLKDSMKNKKKKPHPSKKATNKKN